MGDVHRQRFVTRQQGGFGSRRRLRGDNRKGWGGAANGERPPWLGRNDPVRSKRVPAPAAGAFRADLADGLFTIEWNEGSDLQRAVELDERYADRSMGLVDAVVMAIAERLEAQAIATLDLRDFASVELAGQPALWPRDL